MTATAVGIGVSLAGIVGCVAFGLGLAMTRSGEKRVPKESNPGT
jgi:hypothetical protein